MSLLLWRKLHHGSSAGADAYAVDGNAPEFVADFAGVLNSGTEYYRSGGSDTTFSSVFTHSGLVLPATMTDSDGVLKWAPHNLFLRSDDFTNASWSKAGSSVSGSQFTSASSISRVYQLLTVQTGAKYTVSLRVQKISGDNDYVAIRAVGFDTQPGVWFDIVNGTVGTVDSGWSSASIVLDGTHYIVSATWSGSVTDVSGDISIYQTNIDGNYTNTVGGVVDLSRALIYRSDLGGMVNNPDRGDSYVPTTTAARFLPRRNHYIYNGSSWENAGILIEPAAATNLFPASNFSTGWTSSFLTTSASGEASPTGSADALLITKTSASTSELYEIEVISINTNYSFSVYAKAGTASTLRLQTVQSGNGYYCDFDLLAGTAGTPTIAGSANGYSMPFAYIENAGNEWYRCCVVFSRTTTTVVALITPIGLDTQTMHLFGPQLEVGSTPTSYIPTSGSTVTRAAETLTVAGANLPANTTGVSVQMQGRMTYADLGAEAQRTFWRWYNGASDFLLCDLDTDGADTGEVNANQSDTTGGAGTVAIDAYSPGINVAYNIASRHSNTDINLAVDGTAGTADATPTALHDASSDTFQVAHNLQGTVGMLRVWGVGLSDTDLESAS